ncbi:hypothetical protein BDV98DRAFT_575372 [Pterulicium gracile]|uniref:Uncharacterized protein n=1 Tax=Pterulicium gracile TaxID=1884261 RepID=A0A5C3Q5S9_9AGAR|nr:hypothetical protein BDV98DRAFT_575372 [Pterula gracilis]
MSTTSISSTASTTSTSSSRRMIIPLYSLQAHNMLTNVIVDAGTDARIAKFTKRGMELVDLAVLEPIEVWPTTTAGAVRQSAAIDGLPTGRDSLQLPSATTGGGAHPYGDGSPAGNRSGQHLPELTPSSSRHSVSSAGHSLGQHQTAAVPQAAAVPEPPAVTTPKRNIFGKLFNKNKDRSSKPSSTSSLASTSSMPSIALRSESALTTPTNSPLPQSHIPGHSRATSIATPTPTSSSLAVTKPVSNRHSIISLAPAPPSPAGSRVDLPSDPHHGDASLPPGVPGSTGTGPPLLRPVLGIHPALSCASYPPPPGSRPSMYVWHVRRWMKNEDGGILGGVIGKLGTLGSLDAVTSSGGHGTALVEVRFEWKRGKASSKKQRQRRVAGAASPPGSKGPSRRSSVVIGASESGEMTPTPHNLTVPDQESGSLSAKERKKANRLSTMSQRSGSANGHGEFGGATPTATTSGFSTSAGSAFGGGQAWQGDDSGNESDPEDSETPWTCTLKVRRVQPKSSSKRPPATTADSSSKDSKDKDAVLRIKVGTLSPTPHHPKVVSMLKVPFPLPDIAVDAVEARRRDVGPGAGAIRLAMAAPGHAHVSSPNSPEGNNGAGAVDGENTKAGDGVGGLWLTSEEIKDVVCCTGLWVVVREGFGGVGKVTRKGDGWKLRG